MYLAYVDDYGHTGNDLANAQQPIYMLFALLIPEEQWATAEANLWTIITEIANRTGQDLEGFELHAKDFFNGRNAVYRAISFEEKAAYLERIVRLVVSLECKCIAVHVVKATIQRFREYIAAQKAAGSVAISDQVLTGVFPHPLVFSRLLGEIDNFSKLAQQNSVVIVDHQEEYAESRQLNSHALYRHQTQANQTRILDMPLDGDGRYNTMLQIADVLGWAFGRHLKSIHTGQLDKEEIRTALSRLLPAITSIDALDDLTRHMDIPLSVGLLAEYGMRADRTVSGTTRVVRLTALLLQSIADANKKGKEYPDG